LLSSPIVRYVFWSLIVLLAGYIALVVRYNVIRKRRRGRIAEAKKKLADERKSSAEAGREYRMYREFREDYDEEEERDDSRTRPDPRNDKRKR